MFLYHYYEKEIGPFKNISDVSVEEANFILSNIKKDRPNSFCAKRQESYVADRLYYENILRNEFRKKGGIIERDVPHYMTLGHSPWLATWYEKCECIKIPIEEFDLLTVSFTYGDSHPTFSSRVKDGKEYRKQLYLYDEILKIVEKYGFPQEWNNDGKHGPERYIEAHVWSDKTIRKYM